MKLFPALQNVGKSVLFIQDNKVVGKGSAQIGKGDEWFGIRVESGEILDKLKDLPPFNTEGIGVKHTYIHFSKTLGHYLGLGYTDEYPEVDEILDNVRVVDEFNLGYRMVPDTFKDTEGYGISTLSIDFEHPDAWKKNVKRITVYEMDNWRSSKPADPTEVVFTHIPRNDMTVERVLAWANEFGMVEDPTKLNIAFYFENKDCVWLHYSKGAYYRIGEVEAIELSFGEYSPEVFDENDEGRADGWYSNNTQYFWTGFAEDAIGTFVSRLRAENPGYRFDHPKSEKLDIIKIRQNKELVFESHYDYLDANLEAFWPLVFDGKSPSETGCGGIVGAHGDKAYGYKFSWEKAGIPFHRGTLLYLLTYTPVMNWEKSRSRDWVIEQYQNYLERIKQAEKKVLKNRFNIDVEVTDIK